MDEYMNNEISKLKERQIIQRAQRSNASKKDDAPAATPIGPVLPNTSSKIPVHTEYTPEIEYYTNEEMQSSPTQVQLFENTPEDVSGTSDLTTAASYTSDYSRHTSSSIGTAPVTFSLGSSTSPLSCITRSKSPKGKLPVSVITATNPFIGQNYEDINGILHGKYGYSSGFSLTSYDFDREEAKKDLIYLQALKPGQITDDSELFLIGLWVTKIRGKIEDKASEGESSSEFHVV